MNWTVIIPAWGDYGINHFRDTSYPSIRVAAKYANIEPKIIVHTDRPNDIHKIAPEVFCEQIKAGGDKYRSMSDVHRRGLDTASEGDRIMLLCADIIVSKEVFSACNKRFDEGKKIIVLGPSRTLGPDTPVGLSSGELLDWSMQFAHPYTRECFWQRSTLPPSTFYFRNENNITLRGFHLHPIAVVKDRSMPFSGTLDSDLIVNFSKHEIHVVTDRDEMSMAECSPIDLQYNRTRRPLTNDDIVAWARRSKLTPMNWWLSTHRIVLTGNGDTNDEEIWNTILKLAPMGITKMLAE